MLLLSICLMFSQFEPGVAYKRKVLLRKKICNGMVSCSKFILDYEFQRLQGRLNNKLTQPPFNCSKLTIETLEQSVKYIQS